MTNLPAAISTYFAAAGDPTRQPFDDCFTADAVVHDEDHVHQGIAALKAWHIKAAGPTPNPARVVSLRQDGAKTIVTAEISGPFKGSPIMLDYAFTMRDGLISALDIR